MAFDADGRFYWTESKSGTWPMCRQQEELWLLRGGDPTRPGMLAPEVDSPYDAFKHRRADRPALPPRP